MPFRLSDKYSHNEDDSNFSSSLFALLQRYESIFGESLFEGTGLHGALPPQVFSMLNSEFGVTMECFASPLNCYFGSFCSAFIDTDASFGSCGSFFDFHPTYGSFEANPPFTEELIEKMSIHMKNLLSDPLNDALSFIIFVPDWNDPPSPGIELLKKSSFLSASFSIEGGKHEYVSGGQHSVSSDKRIYRAVHPTKVLIIQNQAV